MGDSLLNMSVLLQFAKFSRGFQISDFKEFVDEIRVENLDFFGRLAYPNQWQIRLTNPEVRENLIRTGKRRINNRSCWVYPLNQQEIRGFIYWLPNSVTNDQLTEYLKLYGEVLLVESQKQKVNTQEIESDRRYYGLLLPHGTVKEDLPHFLKINGFLCLVTVRGRQPACFHCKEVGHRRLECPKYKAKLIGYCFRDPNTASPRLKPRGRRHIQRGTERDADRYDTVSSGDILRLEGKDLVDETIEPHLLSSSDDQDLVTEEQKQDTGSVAENLTESGAHDGAVENRVKSCLDSSDVSFPNTETLSIHETLQQIQRKTSEDLQQRLKNFEKEFAGTLTKRILSTHTSKQKRRKVTKPLDSKKLEVELSNEEPEKTSITGAEPEKVSIPGEEPVKTSITGEDPEKTSFTGEDNDDTCIKGTKGDRIPLTLPTMPQDIIETTSEIENVETNESTAVGLVSVSDMSSVLQMFEKTKEATIEILEGTFKKLTEVAKSNERTETLSKDSIADKDKKFIPLEMHSHLLKLERAKQTATEYSEKTFKNLKEEINNLSSRFTADRTDRDTRLTKDDIQFANQMLKHTKETVERTLQNTFKKLEKEIGKVTEPDEMTADISSESILPIKITVDSTDSAEIRELIKDVVDIVNYFSEEKIAIVLEAESSEKQSSAEHSQESILPLKIREDSRESFEILEEKREIVVEAESSEKQSSAEHSQEEIIQTASSGICKRTKISSQSEESEKMAASMTEKMVTESKRLELQVSETAQEDIEKLQANIREIFASFLAKDESELLPETRTILKQVESKVNQVAEEIKNRLKIDIEDIFASFKVDSFK